MRVAGILIDGAERSFLEELVTAGELPNLARLLATGARVPLRTEIPYCAEYACTELLTGRSASENRYWSTVTFDRSTYECFTVGSALRQPFYAAPTNGSVIVFDMPHSVLTDGVPGEQVVGWGGHDARFQHPRASLPATLMDEIDARFGVDPTAAVEYRGSWHQPRYIDALADALVASARRRADIARWLLERSPDWTLFLMGMTELHSAGHNMSHGVDATHPLAAHHTAAHARRRLVDVWRSVDDTVARVAGALPPDAALAVFSTKGMIPNRDDLLSNVLLPELLHRMTFGRPFTHEPSWRRWQRRGCPPMWPEPDERSGARAFLLGADGALHRVKRRYRLIAPPRARAAVASARSFVARPSSAPAAASTRDASPSSLGALRGEMKSPASSYRDRWPSMRWFALPSFSAGHIRLNVVGRERDGRVRVADYEREIDGLEAELRRSRDVRTGEPVVDDVVRLRADDPLAADGPGADLVVTWRVASDALEHPSTGVIGPFPLPRSGSHTPNGFLYVKGAGIPAGALDEHPAIDVPATLIDLLGWERPGELSGSAIGIVTGVAR